MLEAKFGDDPLFLVFKDTICWFDIRGFTAVASSVIKIWLLSIMLHQQRDISHKSANKWYQNDAQILEKTMTKNVQVFLCPLYMLPYIYTKF